jgi:VWFA-related protein
MVNVGIIAEQKKGAGPLIIEVTEHKQPLAVQELRPASAMPRRIVILVDQSGSAGHLASHYRNAITQIVETLPDYSRDTVAIGAFNDIVGMIVPFTNNKQLLLEKLDKLGGQGRTKLYDAIFLAIGSAIVEMNQSGGLADIIVISDGGENGSSHSLEDIASRIHTSGVRVSVLDVHGPELLATVGGGNDIERLSEIVRTGGGILISTTYDDHAAQTGRFIANLKNSYFVRLHFATPAQGSEKHHIEIHASKGWKLDYPSVVYVHAVK